MNLRMISLAWLEIAELAHFLHSEFRRFGGTGLTLRPAGTDIGRCWTDKNLILGRKHLKE